jgi:hypothetical protein
MDKFPNSFQALRVKTNIEIQRYKNVSEHLKKLRLQVVQACKIATNMFIRVDYKFGQATSNDECKNLYKKVKKELQERTFTVHGILSKHYLHLLLCPRKIEGKTKHSWHKSVRDFMKHHKRQKRPTRQYSNAIITPAPPGASSNVHYQANLPKNLKEIEPADHKEEVVVSPKIFSKVVTRFSDTLTF